MDRHAVAFPTTVGILTVVPKTTAQTGPGGAQRSGHFDCPVYAILIIFPSRKAFIFNIITVVIKY